LNASSRARFQLIRARDKFVLYLITPPEITDEARFFPRCEEVLKAGISVIQYRNKEASRSRAFHRARRLRELCHGYGALFIVNDEIDMATAAGADGVHLGQNDFPLEMARKLAGDERIIGISTHNMMEARAAWEGGADYIGYGALFRTNSKEDAASGTLDGLREIASRISIPVIGIGGITPENISSVAETGAAGAAVISAVWGRESVSKAVESLASSVQTKR